VPCSEAQGDDFVKSSASYKAPQSLFVIANARQCMRQS
jgi:hypothetical protein